MSPDVVSGIVIYYTLKLKCQQQPQLHVDMI